MLDLFIVYVSFRAGILKNVFFHMSIFMHVSIKMLDLPTVYVSFRAGILKSVGFHMPMFMNVSVKMLNMENVYVSIGARIIKKDTVYINLIVCDSYGYKEGSKGRDY